MHSINLIVLILLICFQFIKTDTYYTSPTSELTDLSLCTTISNPCKFSSLIDLNISDLKIILLKGPNGEMYPDHGYKRTNPSNSLILEAEDGAYFSSGFYFWVKQVNHFEMNNFTFPNGIQHHIHIGIAYNVSYILLLDADNMYSSNIYLNNIHIESNEPSVTLFRLSPLLNANVYIDQLNSTFNRFGSSIFSTTDLLDSIPGNSVGPQCNITITNSWINGLTSNLFSINYKIIELTVLNSNFSTYISLISFGTFNDLISRINIKNSTFDGEGNFLNIYKRNTELIILDQLNVYGKLDFKIQLSQSIPFYLNLKRSTFYKTKFILNSDLPSPIDLSFEETEFHGDIIDLKNILSITNEGKLIMTMRKSNLKLPLKLNSKNEVYIIISECNFEDMDEAISIISPYGLSNISYSNFNNLQRGLKIKYSDENIYSSVIVENSNFTNIKKIDEDQYEMFERMGGTIQIKSSYVVLKGNTFTNCNFTSTSEKEDTLKLGIIGIYTNKNTNLSLLSNTFNNTVSDFGGAVVIWYTYKQVLESIIEGNSFIKTIANIGSAIAIFNLESLVNLYIKNNYFDSNLVKMKSTIYINSIFDISQIQIFSNIFKNIGPNNEDTSAIYFDGGSVTNAHIVDNEFINSQTESEIRGQVRNFSGEIRNINILKSTNLLNNIPKKSIIIHSSELNLLIKDINLNEQEIGDAIHINSISCVNITIQDIEAPSTNIFLKLYCSSVSNINLENIRTTGRMEVEEREHLIPHGTIILNNINIERYTNIFNQQYLSVFKNLNVQISNSSFRSYTLQSVLYFERCRLALFNTAIKGFLNTCIKSLNGFEVSFDQLILEECKSDNGNELYASESFYMNNSTIKNSESALDGGGLNIISPKIFILNSTFINLKANRGGGLFISNNNNLTITNTIFDNCQANTGGGMFINKMFTIEESKMKNVLFKECSAQMIGGGMFIVDDLNDVKNAYDNNEIKFENCYGYYSDDIGSNPVRIVIHDKTVRFIGYPFFDWRFNSKYAIIGIETHYGLLRPVSYDGLVMIRKKDNLRLYANCENDIGDLKNKYFCIAFRYDLQLLNSDYDFQINYNKTFYESKEVISEALTTLYVNGYWLPILILLLIIGTIIIFIIIFSLLITFIIMIYIRSKNKKVKFADLELSLLRRKIDQDILIDGGADLLASEITNIYHIKLSDVSIKEKIGSGGSGANVMRGIWKEEDVAFKLFRGNLIEEMKEEFENEILLLSSLYHPNIVRFCGVIQDPPRYGIVTEFCPGSVAKLIKSGYSQQLEWQNKLIILQETASAMEYLIKREIIHRDLKWDNVLMSAYGEVRLTDLGLSRRISENAPNNLTARVGTSYLMAPEVVKGLQYDWKCDVFSFGIMMHELLYDKLDPFESKPGIEFKIAQDPNLRPDVTQLNLSSDNEWIVNLMKQCWEDQSSKRPSFTQLKNDINMHINKKLPKKKIHFTDKGEIEITTNDSDQFE